MSSIVEKLYQLVGTDQLSQFLTNQLRRAALNTAAASHSVVIAIPNDQVWLITNVLMSALSGAGQTASLLDVTVYADAAYSQLYNKLIEYYPTAALNISQSIQPSGLVIRGPAFIRGFASYNAGVQINTTTLNVSALAIPRGNITQ